MVSKEKSQREIKQEKLDEKFKVGSIIDYFGVRCRVVRTKKERISMISFGVMGCYYEPVLELHYIDGHGVIRSVEFDYDRAMSL